MGNLVVYTQRDVKPRGLTKSHLLRKEMVEEYLFLEDLKRLIMLSNHNLALPHQDIRVFYPGCGADILYPLFFLEKLFPSAATIKLLFNDVDQTMPIIRTILDDVGLSFAEKGKAIQFYWKDTLVDVELLQGDVFQLGLPLFNVYFERAFRIIKDPYPWYEQKVYHHLELGGIVISDSGFQGVPLEKVAVPQELSSYVEMIIGIKKALTENQKEEVKRVLE